MKAWITKDGFLTVKSEGDTDAFALQQWANRNIGVALIDADIIIQGERLNKEKKARRTTQKQWRG